MILSQHAAPRMLSLSAGPLHSRPPRVSKKQKEDREWGQNSGPLKARTCHSNTDCVGSGH